MTGSKPSDVDLNKQKHPSNYLNICDTFKFAYWESSSTINMAMIIASAHSPLRKLYFQDKNGRENIWSSYCVTVAIAFSPIRLAYICLFLAHKARLILSRSDWVFLKNFYVMFIVVAWHLATECFQFFKRVIYKRDRPQHQNTVTFNLFHTRIIGSYHKFWVSLQKTPPIQ